MDKPRRGRPPKGGDAKRHAVGIRTTRELKAQIEEAAEASGRSMAQEIEYRLETSFKDEEELGGRRTASLARALAYNIAMIEEVAGARWFETQEAWATVRKTLPNVMMAFVPTSPHADELINQALADILEQKSIDATNKRIEAGDFRMER